MKTMKTFISSLFVSLLFASNVFAAPVTFKGSTTSGDTLGISMEYGIYSTPSGKQELRNTTTWSYSGSVTVTSGVGFQMQWANYVNKKESNKLHENDPVNGASNMILYSFPEANCKEGSLLTAIVETTEATSITSLGSKIQVTPLTGHICSLQITSVSVLSLEKETATTTPTLLGGSTTTSTTGTTSTTATISSVECKVGTVLKPGQICVGGGTTIPTSTVLSYKVAIGLYTPSTLYYVSMSSVALGTKSTTVNTGNSSIPLSPGNRDYTAYLLWLYGITPSFSAQPGTPEYVIINNNGSTAYPMVNTPEVLQYTSNGTIIVSRNSFILNIDGSVTINY